MFYGDLENKPIKEIHEKFGSTFFEDLYTDHAMSSPYYGESYQDVITRINPFLLELMKSTQPTIIVAHSSILKCLYAYLTEKPIQEVAKNDLPSDTLHKFEPELHGRIETRYTFD